MKKVICIGLVCLVVVYAYTADDQDGWMEHYWNKAKQHLTVFTGGEEISEKGKEVERAKSTVIKITKNLLKKGISVSVGGETVRGQSLFFRVYLSKNKTMTLDSVIYLLKGVNDVSVQKDFLTTLFTVLEKNGLLKLENEGMNINDAKNQLLIEILNSYAYRYAYRAYDSDELYKLRKIILSSSDNAIPIKEKIILVRKFLAEHAKNSEDKVLFISPGIKGAKS